MTKRDRTNPICDHALLRYMERVQGIDVEALRNKLATPNLRTAAKLKATKVISEGVEFRINSFGFVATIIDPKKRTGRVSNRKKKRGRRRWY